MTERAGGWKPQIGNGELVGAALASFAAFIAAGLGLAKTLTMPTWLVVLLTTVGALTATATAFLKVRNDRRTRRAAGEQRRRQVLDVLHDYVSADRKDILGLLRADRCPMPFRGRGRELRQLANWLTDKQACPVFILSGPAGVGKSRLALEFASRRLPPGWLHPGAGAAAISAVRACGDPVVMLVDDADGRADLVPLLESLAEQHEDPTVRIVMLTRSATGLRAALMPRLEERHTWIISDPNRRVERRRLSTAKWMILE
jgi:AAA ATPase domain